MRFTVPFDITWNNINISHYLDYYFTLHLSSTVYYFQKEKKLPLPSLRNSKNYCDIYNTPVTDRA